MVPERVARDGVANSLAVVDTALLDLSDIIQPVAHGLMGGVRLVAETAGARLNRLRIQRAETRRDAVFNWRAVEENRLSEVLLEKVDQVGLERLLHV